MLPGEARKNTGDQNSDTKELRVPDAGLFSLKWGSQAEEWRSHFKGLASSSCLRGDWGKNRDRRHKPPVTRLFIVPFAPSWAAPLQCAKWRADPTGPSGFGKALPSVLPKGDRSCILTIP